MRNQWIPGSFFPPATESLGTRLRTTLARKQVFWTLFKTLTGRLTPATLQNTKEETDSVCKAKDSQKNARGKRVKIGTIISSYRREWQQHREEKNNHESGNIRNRCSIHLQHDRGAEVAAASPSEGFHPIAKNHCLRNNAASPSEGFHPIAIQPLPTKQANLVCILAHCSLLLINFYFSYFPH